jgi:predicted amidohydrolase
VRAAAVQLAPALGDVAANRARIACAIASTRADLVVFPECALSGYGFDSKDAAWPSAETVPGPSTEAWAAACKAAGRRTIVGLLERDGDRLFNAAVLVGPAGVEGVYRKTHLPWLGVDRFTTPGDLGFPVFETPVGRIGILVCYDLSFPEAARCLKLGGAQLVCVPTNWPMAAQVSCVHAPPVRAQENHLHLLTCDRVGEEAGFRFRGGSSITDFDGRVLAVAGDAEETILADLDLAGADHNRVVNVPGLYELDRIAHRRPEIYGRITRRDASAARQP